ncbi:MAG: NUDIX hydrolase [Ignavibacteria bacterium]|nr:MAG: NUDIX hydrolase [Ignavibacteria bacterium]
MGKDKSSVPQWFFEQSGVIPFRRHARGIEILLITSARKKRWILPKGVVEPGMSPRASAKKEALEEAGITGRISREAVGDYVYQKWNGHCRVTMFAMQVTHVHESWEEDDIRDRRWVKLEKAQAMLDRKELRTLLKRFETRLEEFV